MTMPLTEFRHRKGEKGCPSLGSYLALSRGLNWIACARCIWLIFLFSADPLLSGLVSKFGDNPEPKGLVASLPDLSAVENPYPGHISDQPA